MNAALFAEFDAPAREALLLAVEWNRQDLDAMADERDRREFCTYCGAIKARMSCCGEVHFISGREFFGQHGEWPTDY